MLMPYLPIFAKNAIFDEKIIDFQGNMKGNSGPKRVIVILNGVTHSVLRKDLTHLPTRFIAKEAQEGNHVVCSHCIRLNQVGNIVVTPMSYFSSIDGFAGTGQATFPTTTSLRRNEMKDVFHAERWLRWNGTSHVPYNNIASPVQTSRPKGSQKWTWVLAKRCVVILKG